jgi:hypothetical protein
MKTVSKLQFTRVRRHVYDRIEKLTTSKGDEYTLGRESALDNFERASADLGIPRDLVLMVYLGKHIDAIKNHVRMGGTAPSSEPITGRIEDAILYLLLLYSMVLSDDQLGDDPD